MGKLLILIGPSSSGKTSILEKLVEDSSTNFKRLITTTTRAPREGEVHGRDYYFMDHDVFEHQWEIGEMVERTEYAGVVYGIQKQTIDEVMNGDQHAVAVLDSVGVAFMKKRYPNILCLYIGISAEEMEKRLKERGSSEEEISKRIRQAKEKELSDAYMSVADRIIWNEGRSLEDTYSDVLYYLLQYGFFESEVA